MCITKDTDRSWVPFIQEHQRIANKSHENTKANNEFMLLTSSSCITKVWLYIELICILQSKNNVARIKITQTLINTKFKCKDQWSDIRVQTLNTETAFCNIKCSRIYQTFQRRVSHTTWMLMWTLFVSQTGQEGQKVLRNRLMHWWLCFFPWDLLTIKKFQ